jgi:hypothetical protein
LLLTSFVLAGVAMYLLVRTLTRQRHAAVAFAFYPYRFSQYAHFEQQCSVVSASDGRRDLLPVTSAVSGGWEARIYRLVPPGPGDVAGVMRGAPLQPRGGASVSPPWR